MADRVIATRAEQTTHATRRVIVVNVETASQPITSVLTTDGAHAALRFQQRVVALWREAVPAKIPAALLHGSNRLTKRQAKNAPTEPMMCWIDAQPFGALTHELDSGVEPLGMLLLPQ